MYSKKGIIISIKTMNETGDGSLFHITPPLQ